MHTQTHTVSSQPGPPEEMPEAQGDGKSATSAHPLSSFVPVTSNSDSPLCPTSFDFIGLVCSVCIFAFN